MFPESNTEEDRLKKLQQELNLEPFDSQKPESVLFYFNLYLLLGNYSSAWTLLSKYSKYKILEIVYASLQESQDALSQQYIVTKEDLRQAFTNNEKWLKEYFWFGFTEQINAVYIVEFADFKSKITDTNRSQVEAIFKTKSGNENKLNFEMFYEDSYWHLGIIESG